MSRIGTNPALRPNGLSLSKLGLLDGSTLYSIYLPAFVAPYRYYFHPLSPLICNSSQRTILPPIFQPKMFALILCCPHTSSSSYTTSTASALILSHFFGHPPYDSQRHTCETCCSFYPPFVFLVPLALITIWTYPFCGKIHPTAVLYNSGVYHRQRFHTQDGTKHS